MQHVGQVLDGKDPSLPSGMGPAKFAPLTSTDVKRSLSQFRNIFTDKRQSFTEDNLPKMVVSHCFYSRNSKQSEDPKYSGVFNKYFGNFG